MANTETVELAALNPVLMQNRELLDYWRSLQAEPGDVPPRARFDPMAVPRVLPDLMLLERIGEADFKVRLMGTALAERSCVDLTGQPLLEALPDVLRHPAAGSLAEVLSLPCVYLLRRRLRQSSGTIPLIEALHLPLSDKSGGAAFVLTTVLEFEGPVEELDETSSDDWQSPGVRQRAVL